MNWKGTVFYKKGAPKTIEKIKSTYNIETVKLFTNTYPYKDLIKEIEESQTGVVAEIIDDGCYFCFIKTQLWIIEKEDIIGFLPVINNNGNIRVCHKEGDTKYWMNQFKDFMSSHGVKI